MQPKSIKFLENSKIELTFTNKLITSYGGFSLLAKLFEKINLRDNIEEIFPISESSPNSKGIYSKILKFGLTVLAGGDRFSHSIYLGDSDEIYKTLFGVEKMVKSSTAITRMFNKINSFKLSQRLSEALWKYSFEKIIPLSTSIKEDYLNFDSKVITRYGNQEGAAKGYNSKKKGRLSHHPILAFLNESKYVVNFWNREGSSSSGNGILDFLKESLSRLGDKIKIKGCIADTGFYKIDLIKYLESLSIGYIIGVPFYQIIQKQIPTIENWIEVEKGLCITEFKFKHQDEKWDKERRYIIVRQEINLRKQALGKQLRLFKDDDEISKYRYGCYITSFEKSPIDIWRQYRLRAGDENIIKENTYDFGLEGFCLDNFYSTEAGMLIRILFYNIINFFRNEILPKKESGDMLKTIRYKYLVIPAQLGRDGRKMVLRLGVRGKALREKIKWIINKIEDYFKKTSKRIAFE